MHTIRVNENTYLRPLQISDAEDIFNTIDSQREYLGRWLPFVESTRSIADSEEFINSVIGVPDNKTEFLFVIIADNKFAGLAGFKESDSRNLKTEIGYWLSVPYQGMGIMTESVKRLCDFGFDTLKMNRIQIKCAVGNIRSSNIPKKLGFQFEGTQRDGERVSEGEFRDIEIYSLLRREWRHE